MDIIYVPQYLRSLRSGDGAEPHPIRFPPIGQAYTIGETHIDITGDTEGLAASRM